MSDRFTPEERTDLVRPGMRFLAEQYGGPPAVVVIGGRRPPEGGEQVGRIIWASKHDIDRCLQDGEMLLYWTHETSARFWRDILIPERLDLLRGDARAWDLTETDRAAIALASDEIARWVRVAERTRRQEAHESFLRGLQ